MVDEDRNFPSTPLYGKAQTVLVIELHIILWAWDVLVPSYVHSNGDHTPARARAASITGKRNSPDK